MGKGERSNTLRDEPICGVVVGSHFAKDVIDPGKVVIIVEVLIRE
jgi:hypothetical protein